MEYEWTYTGGIISKYVPNMIYLIYKIINPDTSIDVSNIKGEIRKSTIAKFGNNVEDLIEKMSSNYSIIIDKVEYHEGCVGHIFRYILSGSNSTFNFSLKGIKKIWGQKQKS